MTVPDPVVSPLAQLSTSKQSLKSRKPSPAFLYSIVVELVHLFLYLHTCYTIEIFSWWRLLVCDGPLLHTSLILIKVSR